MGKFKDKFCVFICLGVVVMNAAAEQLYFSLNMPRTWTGARSHCQVCFKDLVTVMPENSHVIAGMISTDHWIGLRKNFNSTFNSTFSSAFTSAPPSTTTSAYNFTDNNSSSPALYWTQWANGDPLFFQNWYPGWPVPKFPLPKIDCCSCSCTCPVPPTSSTFQTTTGSGGPTGASVPSAQTMSDVTSSWEATTGMDPNPSNTVNQGGTTSENTTPRSVFTTHPSWTTTTPTPTESTCEARPMKPPVIPEPYKYYIEDSCVAILSFGPWIEKHCFELLPFICYEDRFIGEVNVTDIRANSARLSWLPAPGDIQYYRVEINGGNQNWVTNQTNSTFDLNLDSLTAGNGYAVRVFPVKCERDLNSQNKTFYTIPSTVKYLTAPNMTETSITLNWTKPEGNLSFYSIQTGILNNETKVEHFEFGGLERGTCYTFTILTGVQDRSLWSEPANVSQCTKPGIVSDLTAQNNTNMSVSLVWTPPDGGNTGFLVTAYNSSMVFFNETVMGTDVLVDGLPDGQKLSFTVIAVANFTLQGKPQTIRTYTAPREISDLGLMPTHDTINVSWSFIESTDVTFEVLLSLSGDLVQNNSGLRNKETIFTNLKTAAKYRITVYAVIDVIRSKAVSQTIFTFPSPPLNATVRSSTTDSITFQWEPPVNVYNATYAMGITSDFWKTTANYTILNETSYKFENLVSGTKYNFEVYTKTETNISPSAKCSGYTVSDNLTISLSMMCSSETLLLCDNSTTRRFVYKQLKSYVNDFLKKDIIWSIDPDQD